jgi:hypothetical protein
MSYVPHEIGSLIRTRPEEATRMVLEIVDRNGGNVTMCAEEAGTDRRTFTRWIVALDLQKKVASARKKVAKDPNFKRVDDPTTMGRPVFRRQSTD